jgi:hypothetical protein
VRWLQIKGRVQMAPLQFLKVYGSLKDGHTEGYINFSLCACNIAILYIWMFEFNFELWVVHKYN